MCRFLASLNEYFEYTIPMLQKFVDSSFGIGLAYALGRLLPLRLGHSLARFVAVQIAAQRDAKSVRAVRANQWVIRGETLGKEALNQAVTETFQNIARSIFDLYHYIQNPEAAKRLIVLDEGFHLLLQRPEFGDRGLVIAGLHTSNFDLVLQTLCRMGLRMMALTIPNPQGGRRMEFEMRQRNQMNLVPASVEAFRQAHNHLRQGGLVLTGIDRPIPETKARPCFFGRPAMLPTHHVFLATRARVPVMLFAVNQQPDGKYRLLWSDQIEMDHYPDREQELILNAEKVLIIAEDFIRRVPQQWAMSLPVWPETLDLVPK
jgi:phosphatidylinositol dimannoside acyltransferase